MALADFLSSFIPQGQQPGQAPQQPGPPGPAILGVSNLWRMIKNIPAGLIHLGGDIATAPWRPQSRADLAQVGKGLVTGAIQTGEDIGDVLSGDKFSGLINPHLGSWAPQGTLMDRIKTQGLLPLLINDVGNVALGAGAVSKGLGLAAQLGGEVADTTEAIKAAEAAGHTLTPLNAPAEAQNLGEQVAKPLTQRISEIPGNIKQGIQSQIQSYKPGYQTEEGQIIKPGPLQQASQAIQPYSRPLRTFGTPIEQAVTGGLFPNFNAGRGAIDFAKTEAAKIFGGINETAKATASIMAPANQLFRQKAEAMGLDVNDLGKNPGDVIDKLIWERGHAASTMELPPELQAISPTATTKALPTFTGLKGATQDAVGQILDSPEMQEVTQKQIPALAAQVGKKEFEKLAGSRMGMAGLEDVKPGQTPVNYEAFQRFFRGPAPDNSVGPWLEKRQNEIIDQLEKNTENWTKDLSNEDENLLEEYNQLHSFQESGGWPEGEKPPEGFIRLWHGTSARGESGIREQGFKPQSYGGTYFSADPGDARFYPQSTGNLGNIVSHDITPNDLISALQSGSGATHWEENLGIDPEELKGLSSEEIQYKLRNIGGGFILPHQYSLLPFEAPGPGAAESLKHLAAANVAFGQKFDPEAFFKQILPGFEPSQENLADLQRAYTRMASPSGGAWTPEQARTVLQNDLAAHQAAINDFHHLSQLAAEAGATPDPMWDTQIAHHEQAIQRLQAQIAGPEEKLPNAALAQQAYGEAQGILDKVRQEYETPIPQTGRMLDPRYQPLAQGLQSALKDLTPADANMSAEERISEARKLLDGYGMTFPEVVRRMAEQGVEPTYLASLTADQVERFMRGNMRLGSYVGLIPGGAEASGARKIRALTNNPERTWQSFVANSGRVMHEVGTNGVIDWIDKHVAIPASQIPEGAEKNFVTWDPGGPEGKGWLAMMDGSYEEVKPGTMAIPRKVAQSINTMSKDYSHSFFGATQKVLSPWRQLALFYSPHWYIKSTVGNMILTAQELGEGQAIKQWMKAVNNYGGTDNPLVNIYKTITAPFQKDYPTRFHAGAGAAQAELTPGQAIPGQMMLQALPPGPSESAIGLMGQSPSYVGGMKEAYQTGKAAGGMLQGWTQGLNKFIEGHLTRIPEVAHELAQTSVYNGSFEKFVKQGFSSADAADMAMQRVNKALVSYMDSTPFERTVVRSIFPFWNWQKGIAKIAARMPLDHPIRSMVLMNLGKINGELWDEEKKMLPDYYQSLIPIGGGSYLSARALNPLQDAETLTTPSGIQSALNPFLGTLVNWFERPSGSPYAGKEVGPFGYTVPRYNVPAGLGKIMEQAVAGGIPYNFMLEGAAPGQLIGGATGIKPYGPDEIAKLMARQVAGQVQAQTSAATAPSQKKILGTGLIPNSSSYFQELLQTPTHTAMNNQNAFFDYGRGVGNMGYPNLGVGPGQVNFSNLIMRLAQQGPQSAAGNSQSLFGGF